MTESVLDIIRENVHASLKENHYYIQACERLYGDEFVDFKINEMTNIELLKHLNLATPKIEFALTSIEKSISKFSGIYLCKLDTQLTARHVEYFSRAWKGVWEPDTAPPLLMLHPGVSITSIPEEKLVEHGLCRIPESQ